MKIAIIGSGISGLTCANYLHQEHQITIFEANDYVGGHTATVDVEVESGTYAIDTGFIVYNDKTYPNFIRLLDELGLQGRPTQMSFSVHNDKNGLEYNGHTIATLFAQKRNIFNPKFYGFIKEILRFNQLAKKVDIDDVAEQDVTLGDFLKAYQFSDYFCENYILPMGAAIWSSSMSDMRGFPLTFFVRFFDHHGLLNVADRPQWRVIPGGSREYIRKMLPKLSAQIRLNCPVYTVSRGLHGVLVRSQDGDEQFDQVIFCCHSDQALQMLEDPSKDEVELLSKIPYRDNEVVLHTDTSLLPKARVAWASWNYWLPNEFGAEHALPSVTYNMNILQGIQSPETFCVTLNKTEAIQEDKILRKFHYSHPVFTAEGLSARKQKHLIQGVNKTWFAGAYWYNGFHEDGVRSALDVVMDIINQQALRQAI